MRSHLPYLHTLTSDQQVSRFGLYYLKNIKGYTVKFHLEKEEHSFDPSVVGCADHTGGQRSASTLIPSNSVT